ncbi:hypothetical protein [Cryptosporangium sp. NPDC051539]|uniref:hypothetical protein n=1 Tax=Cryptosporangium sp. NPDC051539 TaxID=3363962 RepID=UPI00379DEBCA
MTTAGLLFRLHRTMLTAWTLLLVVVSGATVTAYQTTYATPGQRRVATDLAQHDAATTVMYGRLHDPGTSAQMFAWEVGAIVTILAGVGAVLAGVALTRAAEDDGTMELLRASGIDARVPFRGAVTVLVAVSAALAAGCAVVVGLAGILGDVEAVTWPGALAFGCLVGATFLLVALGTVVLAQVAPGAGAARLYGFAALGASFLVRAVADTQDLHWLNRVTPLGLRALVRPFGGDRWWVLAACVPLAALLALAGGELSGRREFGAGLLPRREPRDRRLAVRSTTALLARLHRESMLAWTIGVASIGTTFSAMGSGVLETSKTQDVGGFLGSQLGTGDPVAGYFSYSGTVAGLVVCAYAVLGVLRAARDEEAGLTDLVRTVGRQRWAPLAAQVGVVAGGAAVILLASGALAALITPLVIDGSGVAVRAFAYDVGQWPAAVAIAGLTALLVGVWPRLRGLAWVPLLGSGVLSLLGALLGVPQSIQELSVFRHVPDVAGSGRGPWALVVLAALGAVSAAAGIVAAGRRDTIAR